MADVGRLRWRCRRGMRELDALMLGWLDTHYAEASDSERLQFEALLELQDPVIMDMIKTTTNMSVAEHSQNITMTTQGRDHDKDFQTIMAQICGSPGR